MRIVILGPGRLGSSLAGLLDQAGHALMLCAYRDEDAAWRLADSLGAKLGSLEDARRFGQVFCLCVPHPNAAETLRALRPAPGVLIDCTNQFGGHINGAGSSSEQLARLVQEMVVVKAFNTLRANDLRGRAHAADPVAMPYCTDGTAAGARVDGLIHDCGFAPLNLGPLANGVLQEPGGPFFLQALGFDEAVRMASAIESTAGLMPAAHPE
jgi:predicted dinucleotide-binding enzyme